MALTKKQQELDVIKWLKSEELGHDACGTFDYCAKCDMSVENPCEKAYKKFNAKPATKKAPAKKAVKAEVKKEVAVTEAKAEVKPAKKTAKKSK